MIKFKIQELRDKSQVLGLFWVGKYKKRPKQIKSTGVSLYFMYLFYSSEGMALTLTVFSVIVPSKSLYVTA
jgi:hypothetical protein